MSRGEYESVRAIYSIVSDFIPAPHAWGRYKAKSPAASFYLSDFVDMDVKTAADPIELATKLSMLHKNSQSPTGQLDAEWRSYQTFSFTWGYLGA